MTWRGFLVWGGGIVLVLGTFLIFVAAGWPGDNNSCVKPTADAANTCYCEAFTLADVTAGKSGVRQPVNTWFNLYSILTSLLVTIFVFVDRQNGDRQNPMRSHAWIPDLYIFAVLFLGLGSMWFHASLKSWAGLFDQMSMFVYAGFLVAYSIYRLWDSDVFFGIIYAAMVITATIIAAFWEFEFASLILILAFVVAYLVLEIILCVKIGSFMLGKPLTIVLWSGASVAIILATIFWALSQTGGSLCDKDSAFQPHGLLWHPLAGVMAVLLYFYWREENVA